MRIATGLTAIVLLGIFSGCDESRRSVVIPTGPSSPSPPASPSPTPLPNIRATIALTRITPGSGSTVSVRDCSPQPGAGNPRLCTEDINATFSIAAEDDVPNAFLEVVFSDGDRRCASGSLPVTALSAGTSITVSSNLLFLTSEVSEGEGTPTFFQQPCTLPATTTRVALQIWRRDRPQAPVKTQGFGGTYTFAPR